MAALTSYQGGQNNRQLVIRPEQLHHKEPNVEGERTQQAAVHRRTLDWSGPYVKLLQKRQGLPTCRWYDPKPLQPTAAAAAEMLPPVGLEEQPGSSFCTNFVHSSRFKSRGAISSVAWTPEGRRCLTGTNNGEFTLWHGNTFHYETQLQAHESGVRDIVFTHNENWLVTSDGAGQVKYWKLNLELVKVIPAHRESVRGLAFSCTDLKFVTGSDDSTLKIWDFATASASATMSGHGGDIKACDWHPSKSLVTSGSKDTLIKFWDPREASSALHTLHAHKAALSSLAFHRNGNWLLSSARDHIVKVWDLRTMREVATCKGHPRDVACAIWHPCQEEAFVSGDYDGNIFHWLLSRPGPQAEVVGAHVGQVWCLAYHPVGHCLASGGYDGQVKFWCRTRPGDAWLDRAPHDAHLMAAPAEGPAAVTGLTFGGGGNAIPGIDDADVAAPTVAKFEMNPGVTTTGDDISSQLLTGPVPGPRPPRGPPPSAPPGMRAHVGRGPSPRPPVGPPPPGPPPGGPPLGMQAPIRPPLGGYPQLPMRPGLPYGGPMPAGVGVMQAQPGYLMPGFAEGPGPPGMRPGLPQMHAPMLGPGQYRGTPAAPRGGYRPRGQG